MPSLSQVVLILGAGPNIGQAVARNFASKGYKVALASRSLKEADSTDTQLNISTDLTNTDDVVNAFTKVTKVFGIPSVVVYNGKQCIPEHALESLLNTYPQPAPPRSPQRRIHSTTHWPTLAG